MKSRQRGERLWRLLRQWLEEGKREDWGRYLVHIKSLCVLVRGGAEWKGRRVYTSVRVDHGNTSLLDGEFHKSCRVPNEWVQNDSFDGRYNRRPQKSTARTANKLRRRRSA